MTPSIWQLLIVLVIVLLLFGRGKIPQLMGDMAKGIKSFKRGMSDEEKKEDKERLIDKLKRKVISQISKKNPKKKSKRLDFNGSYFTDFRNIML